MSPVGNSKGTIYYPREITTELSVKMTLGGNISNAEMTLTNAYCFEGKFGVMH